MQSVTMLNSGQCLHIASLQASGIYARYTAVHASSEQISSFPAAAAQCITLWWEMITLLSTAYVHHGKDVSSILGTFNCEQFVQNGRTHLSFKPRGSSESRKDDIFDATFKRKHK